MSPLAALQDEVVNCERCPRLRDYCARIARTKRRAWSDWEYWGRPVPSFGDPNGRLLIIGLAPGAHGANRTGRMFTGDASGDFLFRALHRAGFASQAESVSRDDGVRLIDCYLTAFLRCAPPDNKPLPGEIRNCRPYLERELDLLPRVRVVVALGRMAFEVYLSILKERGVIARRAAFAFGHNVEHRTAAGAPLLISSYHPSQQNTATGKLTDRMLLDVFQRARAVIER